MAGLAGGRLERLVIRVEWKLQYWVYSSFTDVDIGFSPDDSRDDEHGAEAGEDDDQGVDGDQGVGQPVRDCQHWQLKRGGRGIVHHLETERR